MTSLELAPPLAPMAMMPLFRHVVLGIDFGPASLAAARWATENVARRASAILSHVMPAREHRSADEDDTGLPDDESVEARPALMGGLGGFAATLALASARSVVRTGQPSRCLSAIADGDDASLVVLGRRGDANRKRVGEPNVIERLARRTRASVLVVPEGVTQPPHHILAAVDESHFAPAVLRAALWLARLHQCPLTVLHVLSPLAGAYDRVMHSGRRALAEQSPAAPLKRLPPNPVPHAASRWLTELADGQPSPHGVRFEVVAGDPTTEIVGMAARRGAPLVLVGPRGADDAPLGSLGSVTRELLTRAPMGVMVVR